MELVGLIDSLATQSDEEFRETTRKMLDGRCGLWFPERSSELSNCVDGSGASAVLPQSAKAKFYRVKRCPIWKVYGTCSPATISITTPIRAADASGRVLPSQLLSQYHATKEEFGRIGGSAVNINAMIGLWPARATPLTQGNPNVPVLVTGVLVDSATSYKWSQKMHDAFPAGSLITWQGYQHISARFFWDAGDLSGVGSDQCNKAVFEYFQHLKMPQNGLVCHAVEAAPTNSK